MILQPLVEQPPSDDAKETGIRDGGCGDARRVLWQCSACLRREPADRNALRSLRCAARLVATTVRAARNSSGSFGRNGNGGAAPRRARLAMTHAIYSSSGSFRQNSRGAIRICRLASFGHNDILFWLSELFWLGDLLWLSEPRVRLAEIACVGLRRLGFVRRNFAVVTGAPRIRSAKIFQIALLRVSEKAGDPPKLFVHFGVRVRIRVWQTRQAGPIATAAISTVASPQSHIVQRCGRGRIPVMAIRCERRCGIELPDGALAHRKRALLVAMRRLRPSESGAIQARHGEDLSACQSCPGDLDLRRRDPACHREALAARIGTCNGAR